MKVCLISNNLRPACLKKSAIELLKMEIRKKIMTRSRDTAPESGSSSPLLRGGGGGAGGGQYNAVSLVLFFLWFLFMFLKLCLRVYLLKITFSCSTVESEGSML